ncbi:MAG TPA: sulfite oxidase [Gemmatimonadales bacterium]
MSTDELVTPADRFFTRSHGSIPTVDPGTWRLDIDGLVDRPTRLTLEDLGRFERREVTATLVCAGLRRSEFLALGPLPGELPWGPEPASTGRWTGIALGDVLRTVGVAPRARFVEMTGLDRVKRQGEQFGFGGSIDLTKALSDEVLLATELNGSALPPVHGFPVRAVVPGWIGARSVKWLGRITLRDEPSSNYFQSKAYRVQRKINPSDPRDVSGGIALSEVPLNVVIVEPAPKQVVAAGPVRVRGWALGSGGHALTAIEVSTGSEQEWIPAGSVAKGTDWSWTLWEATMELPRGRHTLVARATDCTGATQPPMLSATWNVKGYNNNAWHRVTVRAV